jgi:hypothetical protein
VIHDRARIIWHGDGLPVCCAGRSAICSSARIQSISGFIRQDLPCHRMVTASDEALGLIAPRVSANWIRSESLSKTRISRERPAELALTILLPGLSRMHVIRH